MVIYESNSWRDTFTLGALLGDYLRPTDIILLSGELGSGKTTFIKGIVTSFGIKERLVNSPSFVLLNIYKNRVRIFHFDFYRIQSIQEVRELGFFDFLGQGLILVEWPEIVEEELEAVSFLKLSLEYLSFNRRRIIFYPHKKGYEYILKKLDGAKRIS